MARTMGPRWNGYMDGVAVRTGTGDIYNKKKAAGIQIYTIQVNTNNDNTSSVMSYCASGSSNYFATTSASGISSAFSSIGASLSKLRIAK